MYVGFCMRQFGYRSSTVQSKNSYPKLKSP